MKAVYITAYGEDQGFEYKEDATAPVVVEGKILIANRAASINPFDVKLKSGMFKEHIPLTLPVIGGGDFAGVVSAVGEGAAGFSVGDGVYGSAMILNGGSGSYADTVVCNMGNMAKKPDSISFEQAAAFVLVGASAVQAIDEHLNVQTGQKILIHGGSGGIGQIAIQLAKAKGAYVATTTGPEGVTLVKEFGADEIIDYHNQKFEDMIKDYDGVFDTVGGDTLTKSFQVIKKGGTLVSMLGQNIAELAKQYDVTAIGQMTQTNTQHLEKLADYIDEGLVKVQIAQTFQLQNMQEAYTAMNNHPIGKIVVQI